MNHSLQFNESSDTDCDDGGGFSNPPLESVEESIDHVSGIPSISHGLYRFSIFPSYIPESSYTSSPEQSPPPEEHGLDQSCQEYETLEKGVLCSTFSLYSSHLSVIEEDCNPLCVSHKDPLQHIYNHLSIINNEIDKMERSPFLKNSIRLSIPVFPDLFPLRISQHFPCESSSIIHSLSVSDDSHSLLGQTTNKSVYHLDGILEKIRRYNLSLHDIQDNLHLLSSVEENKEVIKSIEDFIDSLLSRMRRIKQAIDKRFLESEDTIHLIDPLDSCDLS